VKKRLNEIFNVFSTFFISKQNTISTLKNSTTTDTNNYNTEDIIMDPPKSVLTL
jgi:hypothetical protein